ncbi:MAG TPA: sucrose synthase [Ignavibacteriales bacterium]|nr:sucrose synthase [Ignavibacteriales bacterium]
MQLKSIIELIEENKTDFFSYLNRVVTANEKLCVKGNHIKILEAFKKNGKNNNYEALSFIIKHISESVTLNNIVYLEIREVIGKSDNYLFNVEEYIYEKISAKEYLIAKEKFVKPDSDNNQLTLNFETFYRKFPSVSDHKSIGKGFEYLNRYLSSKMFTEPENLRKALFNFLFVHKYKSQQLILNDRINSHDELIKRIDKALSVLKNKKENEPYSKFKNRLQEIGFEPGLGNTAGLITETLEQLRELMQAPDHELLKGFLSKIPMIFNIVTVSPHGYFGQQGVLGKPDTGGQVVYILDQVKALEQAVTDSIKNSGVNAVPKILILTRLIPNAEGTTCNKRLEKVFDTKNTYILRVPFRAGNKKVTDNWISRFEIWPYLENFAEDSYRELLAELGEKPDLVIGNYSDGNMVATILSRKFKVTQCNIAHALEKCKYLFSGLYWDKMDNDYHFSVQFTADLIAMNSANFILTSSYQEIAGTDEVIGQYESYLNFSMPGLYRVTGGINLFHPKFNIVSPGVNKKIFFPYTENESRVKEIQKELNALLFENIDDPDTVGNLEHPERIPIFTMGRLDKIKNITALVKWFGENSKINEQANLIVIAGKINANDSTDLEEKDQINVMHNLIDKYKIKNKIRWIGKLLRKDKSGEVYRVVADRKGIFVQCGLFEGFGLTVIESMRSGLPTFATLYGGPLEIIENKKSGFLIDPIAEKESQKIILSFLEQCKKNPKYWNEISENGIKRVDTTYNWELHANKLLSLSKIFGFWNYTSNIEMSEMNAYLDLLYHTIYKPGANKIKEIHDAR